MPLRDGMCPGEQLCCRSGAEQLHGVSALSQGSRGQGREESEPGGLVAALCSVAGHGPDILGQLCHCHSLLLLMQASLSS